jgi:hypothetical protein
MMTRRVFAILLLLVMGSLPAAAGNMDLRQAIRILASRRGRPVYICADVRGQVACDAEGQPVETNLASLRRTRSPALKAISDGDVLIVGFVPNRKAHPHPPYKIPLGGYPQEILLEVAPSNRIMPYLQACFPDVEFRPHPTMNGFYTIGSRKDILEIKSMIGRLDQPED